LLQLFVGSVQAKNAKNTLFVVLANVFMACLAFYICGFAAAFGGTYGDAAKGNRFIGWGGFFLKGLSPSELGVWLFQFAVRPYWLPSQHHLECT
jgi:ammonia channel protein AmtB